MTSTALYRRPPVPALEVSADAEEATRLRRILVAMCVERPEQEFSILQRLVDEGQDFVLCTRQERGKLVIWAEKRK